MRRILPLVLLLAAACGAPPPPVTAPVASAPPPPVAAADRVIETVRVSASALNVRAEPTTDAPVVLQVKKGASLAVLGESDGWLRVRLEAGETGWVAERFVTRAGASPSRSASRSSSRRGGCPPNSDFAFTETPTLSFSEVSRPGLVVVDASVNAAGNVTGTKVVSNSTGDESLAFLAEREIRSAKFAPPIRDCRPRAFIFTYRRTF